MEAKAPGPMPALVEDRTQGDSMKPLTWTTKSLRRLAGRTRRSGPEGGPGRDTVRPC